MLECTLWRNSMQRSENGHWGCANKCKDKKRECRADKNNRSLIKHLAGYFEWY